MSEPQTASLMQESSKDVAEQRSWMCAQEEAHLGPGHKLFNANS